MSFVSNECLDLSGSCSSSTKHYIPTKSRSTTWIVSPYSVRLKVIISATLLISISFIITCNQVFYRFISFSSGYFDIVASLYLHVLLSSIMANHFKRFSFTLSSRCYLRLSWNFMSYPIFSSLAFNASIIIEQHLSRHAFHCSTLKTVEYGLPYIYCIKLPF